MSFLQHPPTSPTKPQTWSLKLFPNLVVITMNIRIIGIISISIIITITIVIIIILRNIIGSVTVSR